MRVWLSVAAASAAAAVLPPEALRGAVATAASTLVEATPLLLAGALIVRVLRTRAAVAYLGCGCGSGPSARSLPAAAMAWIALGPAIACARLLAAALASRVLAAAPSCAHDHAPHLLDELSALVPSALLAGAAATLAAAIDLRHVAPPLQLAAGAALGFASAPCGLGAVAIAGSLHARAPLVAIGFLCIAGIADARAFAGARRAGCEEDGGAYACLALALAIVAAHRGGALVHPAIAPLLFASAIVAAVLAVARRGARCNRAFAAPLLMIAGAFANAPPPAYHATETTLSDLFAGERITFTGTQVRAGTSAALVRYAITCCRADAAPIVVRLTHALAYPPGTWLRVEGTVEGGAGDLRLAPSGASEISPPADPFVYR